MQKPLIFFVILFSLQVNASSPDELFALLLSSKTATSHLYKLAYQAGLIDGLQTSTQPNCLALTQEQSKTAEISLIKLFCATQLNDKQQAEKIYANLLATPKI